MGCSAPRKRKTPAAGPRRQRDELSGKLWSAFAQLLLNVVGQHLCLIVLTIFCGKEQGEGLALGNLDQTIDIRILLELTEIAGSEFLEALGVVPEPLA